MRNILSGLFLFMIVCQSANASLRAAHQLNLPGDKIIEGAEFRIIHRFYGAANRDEFLGIDIGANVDLGLGFKLRDNLDVSLLRSRLNKEYLLSTKLALIDAPAIGLTLSLGGTYKSGSAITKNKSSFFSQLIIAKTFLRDKLLISVIPSFSTATDLNDASVSNNDTFGIGTALSYSWLVERGNLREIELVGENTLAIYGHRLKYSTWALGAKLKTWGHVFSLLLTNSLSFLPNNYISGTDSLDYYFGFNIVRKF